MSSIIYDLIRKIGFSTNSTADLIVDRLKNAGINKKLLDGRTERIIVSNDFLASVYDDHHDYKEAESDEEILRQRFVEIIASDCPEAYKRALSSLKSDSNYAEDSEIFSAYREAIGLSQLGCTRDLVVAAARSMLGDYSYGNGIEYIQINKVLILPNQAIVILNDLKKAMEALQSKDLSSLDSSIGVAYSEPQRVFLVCSLIVLMTGTSYSPEPVNFQIDNRKDILAKLNKIVFVDFLGLCQAASTLPAEIKPANITDEDTFVEASVADAKMIYLFVLNLLFSGAVAETWNYIFSFTTYSQPFGCELDYKPISTGLIAEISCFTALNPSELAYVPAVGPIKDTTIKAAKQGLLNGALWATLSLIGLGVAAVASRGRALKIISKGKKIFPLASKGNITKFPVVLNRYSRYLSSGFKPTSAFKAVSSVEKYKGVSLSILKKGVVAGGAAFDVVTLGQSISQIKENILLLRQFPEETSQITVSDLIEFSVVQIGLILRELDWLRQQK